MFCTFKWEVSEIALKALFNPASSLRERKRIRHVRDSACSTGYREEVFTCQDFSFSMDEYKLFVVTFDVRHLRTKDC